MVLEKGTERDVVRDWERVKAAVTAMAMEKGWVKGGVTVRAKGWVRVKGWVMVRVKGWGTACGCA